MKKSPGVPAEIVKLEAALDDIVPDSTRIEKLGGGFGLAEGPLWIEKGYLLFSDVANNVIHKWAPASGKVSVFMKRSGYTGRKPSKDPLHGSNGLTLDPRGRLTMCQHGNRRVVRLEKNGRRTVLADRFENKRLNSPNDLVSKSDGSVYFTDPPALLQVYKTPEGGFGLKTEDDPRKELPFSGVYRVADGKVELLYKDLPLPNGLAFSPDEKYLYVNDSVKKIYMRFEVQPDGRLAKGQVFCDMSGSNEPGAPDGMKIDQRGNVYGTGPGGFWIISPEGKHLGTIKTPEHLSNLAWGDSDGKTLYMTGITGLYRIRLKIPGLLPGKGGLKTTGQFSKVERQVIELEKRKSQAEMKGDLGFVERVVADDYIQVFGGGEPGTKATLLGMLKSPDLRIEKLQQDLFQVRVYGNVAMLFDRTTIEARQGGHEIGGQFRTIRIYVKRRGKWQCTAFQATPIG